MNIRLLYDGRSEVVSNDDPLRAEQAAQQRLMAAGYTLRESGVISPPWPTGYTPVQSVWQRQIDERHYVVGYLIPENH